MHPDVVFVFANPDQISVLVTMLGSHNGEALNTLAPFGAACHSIVYAVEQISKDHPMAIMGLFDISQRREALANSLSMTMLYALWEEADNYILEAKLLRENNSTLEETVYATIDHSTKNVYFPIKIKEIFII